MEKMTWLLRRTILITILLASCFLSYAQSSFPVKGKITDDKAQPLEGVTVQEKGTSNFTITKADGNFQLTVTSGTAVLVLSSVGFTTQEIDIQNRAEINHSLSAAPNSMNEVVVIGYGTKTRATVTSSIVSVNAEEIRSRPVANALQAIQGKAAGVDITSNERPGEVGSIFIRGVRSIKGNNGPLFVVDNVPLNFGGISAINPNDIETIDILKDASATAV